MTCVLVRNQRQETSSTANGSEGSTFTFVRGAHLADAMAEGIKRSPAREAATVGESKGERGKASARAERPDSKTFTFVRGAHLADVMDEGIQRSLTADTTAHSADDEVITLPSLQPKPSVMHMR